MQGKEIESWFEKEFGRKIGHNHVYDCNDYYNYVKRSYAKFPNGEGSNKKGSNEETPNKETAKKDLQKSNHINWNLALILYAVMFIIAMLILGTSCTSVKYVPVPSITAIKDSTVIRDSVRVTEKLEIRDSVAIRDSVVNVVDEDGNLIRKELYHTREIIRSGKKEIEKLQAALKEAMNEKQDSIRVPYPVEKPLTRWQQLKQDAGEISIILNIILVVFLGILIRRKCMKGFLH